MKKPIVWTPKKVLLTLVDDAPENFKIQTDLGRARLKKSLELFGLANTMTCNYSKKKGRYDLIDGHSRKEKEKKDKTKWVWISLPSRRLSDKEFREMLAMLDFARAGEVDVERIERDLGTSKQFFDKWKMLVPTRVLDSIGKTAKVNAEDFRPEKEKEKEERDKKSVVLRDKFIEPPFSILDARNGNWQQRKQEWLELGIKGEIGRATADDTVRKGGSGKNRALLHAIPTKSYDNMDEYYSKETQELNTSIFDPALCELMYAWFCPKKGNVLDPFAGGSVRGIVANYMGLRYTGIDLSRRQIEANRKQGIEILKKNNQPLWLSGDSEVVLTKKFQQRFDFVFSCPPYFDLEVYSKDEADLSNMKKYDDFIFKYQKIIERSLLLLKPKRYACFVVSQVRDKKGYYQDLVGDTVRCFERCGASFYNDAVLLNMVGSASLRADRQFSASKKLVRVHQNVLIFYKP